MRAVTAVPLSLEMDVPAIAVNQLTKIGDVPAMAIVASVVSVGICCCSYHTKTLSTDMLTVKFSHHVWTVFQQNLPWLPCGLIVSDPFNTHLYPLVARPLR